MSYTLLAQVLAWQETSLSLSPLICPLQHTAVWKQCFVRSVLPPWNLPFVNRWQRDEWMQEKLIFYPKSPISVPNGQNWNWSGDKSADEQFSCHWSEGGLVMTEKYLFLKKIIFCSEWQSIAKRLPSNPGLWILGTWGAVLEIQRDFLISP